MLKAPMPIHFGVMLQRFHHSRVPIGGVSRAPFWLVMALVGLLTPCAVAQDEQLIEEMEAWAKSRMPSSLTAIASGILQSPSLTAGRLEMAAALLEVATDIGTDSLPAWRKQMQLASAMRDDIPGAEALEMESNDVIARLDPTDQVARLRQILLRIAQRQTAEERIEGYNSFLTPEAVKTIGPIMASRIAFDLALLEKRTGDTEAYIQAVARSVELDPHFPPSVASAAGFFRMVSDSVEAEVELLIAAVTADPLNGTLMRGLGKVLLRNGAYESAAKVLKLALELTNTSTLLGRSIIEDYAIALWGAGESERAVEFLNRKQRDRVAGLLSLMQNRDMDQDRHSFLKSDPAPTPELALLKAAILSDSQDITILEAFQPELERAFTFQEKLFQEDIAVARDNNQAQQMNLMIAGLASLFADQAWARLWCNLDVKTVPDLIDQALSSNMIDQGQSEVLKGWLAYREGRLDDARAILEPIAENTPFAASGLALVEHAQGNVQAAARLFLKVYSDVPGTAIGLWSRGELGRILGSTISPPQGAAQLEQLAAQMPKSVSRIVNNPKTAIAVSITPMEKPLNYFDPLKVKVRLRNTTGIPLAIGKNCPIEPTLAIIPQITAAAVEVPPIAPLVFSTERSLQIPANDGVEFELDLSATLLGTLLNNISLQGATVRLRCVVNFKVVEQNVTPGVFGEQVTSLPIRINGAFQSEDLVEDLNRRLAELREFDSLQDLKDMAIIGQTLGIESSWLQKEKSVLIDILTERFEKLGPMAKAWFLSQVTSFSDDLVRIQDIAVTDQNPAIFAVLLSGWSTAPGDAAIVVGRQSDNPLIRRMAEATQVSTEIIEKIKQREFDLVEEEPGGVPAG